MFASVLWFLYDSDELFLKLVTDSKASIFERNKSRSYPVKSKSYSF